LSADRGIEVGHIFKLGTFLSEKLSAVFLDENGVSRPAVMGCYGIGLGRLLAAVIEHSHDEKGIIWPMALAPYQVHICTLNPDKDGVASCGERLYEELQAAGVEVLYDDRMSSPGVKFNDADLIGVPLRVTVSPRALASASVEVKQRSAKESGLVPVDGATASIATMVRDALAAQNSADAGV
jgi:prolyl-tRNA synthetase